MQCLVQIQMENVIVHTYVIGINVHWRIRQEGMTSLFHIVVGFLKKTIIASLSL